MSLSSAGTARREHEDGGKQRQRRPPCTGARVSLGMPGPRSVINTSIDIALVRALALTTPTRDLASHKVEVTKP